MLEEITELYKLEDIVRMILTNIPSTRNNDMTLYSTYLRLKLESMNSHVSYKKVFEDKEFRRKNKIMEFESVSRCRRKIQSTNPELAPIKEVRTKREDMEEAFITYAIGG